MMTTHNNGRAPRSPPPVSLLPDDSESSMSDHSTKENTSDNSGPATRSRERDLRSDNLKPPIKTEVENIGASVRNMMRQDPILAARDMPKPYVYINQNTTVSRQPPNTTFIPKHGVATNLKLKPILTSPLPKHMQAISSPVSSPLYLSPQRVTKNDINLIKMIATGGQGAVFLARLRLDSTSLVVVKVFYNDPNEYEVMAMRQMALTNFSVRLLAETRVSRSQIVVFKKELASQDVDMETFKFDEKDECLIGWCFERLHTDLERVLLKRGSMGNALKCLIGLQIAYFVRGIHQNNYIFRDLKPSNVLLCIPTEGVTCQQVIRLFLEQTPVIKVADYGLVTHDKRSKKTKHAGTIGYMPSSQMESTNYGKSVDVNAYCVTLCELFTNELLYHQDDPDSDVEHEFRTLEAAERAKNQLLRHRAYIPSLLIQLIHSTLTGQNTSVEPFIQFFETTLKYSMFTLDTPRSDMLLLNKPVMATPLRTV